MKNTCIILSFLLLAGCRFRDRKFMDTPVPNFIPAAQQDSLYRNFTLCYQDLHQYEFVERGLIGEAEGKKIYFETWFFPNIRNMALKFLFIRTDTARIRDYDFCLQEIPLDENFEKDYIICYKKEGERFYRDSALTLGQVPGMLQPLVLYMNGWQNLRHMNRGKKDDPKIYIRNNILYLEYYNYDADQNKTAVKKEYPFNGEKFVVEPDKEPVLEADE